MEEKNITEEIVQPQPAETTEAFPIKKKKPWLMVTLIALIIIIFGTIGILAYRNYLLKNQIQSRKETNQIEPTNIPTFQTGTEWLTHVDKEVGFSFEYPSNTTFLKPSYEEQEGEECWWCEDYKELEKSEKGYSLSLLIRKFGSYPVNGPLGHSEKDALEDRALLEKSEFGLPIDCPEEISKNVIKLDDKIFAKDFVDLGCLEVCDLKFKRELIFYKDNYQILITWLAPTKPIVKSIEKYFTLQPKACGQELMWDWENDAKDLFYKSIINKTASEEAQSWYYTFSKIIDSIKFLN